MRSTGIVLPFKSARVLGVRVDVASAADIVQFMRQRLACREPAHIVTVNAEFVMIARRHQEFADVLESADLATPDSAGVLWAMNRQSICAMERVGGSDLIWKIAEMAATDDYAIFLLGGEDRVAARAAEVLSARWPALRISGTYAGSPRATEEEYIVDLIRQSGAMILLVAFGAPEQDIWIAKNLRRTGVFVAMGVGGSFDYVAGTAKRAPLWMRSGDIEWLWRLYRQPWRWRRMRILPRFVWLVWRDRNNVKENA
jgi:N-acetylglucosaminyldiphosphoundecaprenol N-acetyl-beta-D-mannosaminyltransferase